MPTADTLVASLLTVLGIWAVTVMTPGPNFLAVAHATLARSRRHGLWVVAGIAAGTAVWAAASLAGLGLLFRTAGWLYTAVKLLGGAYLIYLGLRMILASRRPSRPHPAAGTGTASATPWSGFRRGLLVDLSNPKAAAFFTSLFAVAVPPTAPLWLLACVVAAVVGVAAAWYGAVALTLGSRRVSSTYRRAERLITAVAGALFMALGLRLATAR